MAELAKGRLRRKIPQLELALEGKLQEHHRFLLRLQQSRLDAVETDLAILDFQSVSQLASWVGVCPGNNESAGKRKSSRIPKGNVYLKLALVEAANAAARAKGTYLRDKFYRLKARRGYTSSRGHRPQDLGIDLSHAFPKCFLQRLGRPLSGLNRHHLTRNLVHRLERCDCRLALPLGCGSGNFLLILFRTGPSVLTAASFSLQVVYLCWFWRFHIWQPSRLLPAD